MTDVTHAELAADTGSSLIGHKAEGAGAVTRTVQDKLRDVLHAKDFGAVGNANHWFEGAYYTDASRTTLATDDTDALVALLEAMQTQGKPGLLGGEGQQTNHLIHTGQLKWTFNNSGNLESPGPAGPVLLTAGKVVLAAKPGTGNSPFIAIHNDAALGHRIVHGGSVGDLYFEDRTNDGSTHRHGILLYGVEFMHFGNMFSNSLQGDLIHIEKHGDASTADAWHVYGCIFDSASTWATKGWTFNNDSVGQVFVGNRIGRLWNQTGEKGAFRGPGASNEIGEISCSVTGQGPINSSYAVDLVPDTGTVQRIRIGFMELDAPKYGIRISGVQMGDIGRIRFVHRRSILTKPYPPIPLDTTWPLVAIQFDEVVAGQQVADVTMRVTHRVEGEITADTQLGLICDFNNKFVINRTRVEHGYSIVTGFTPSISRFISFISSNSVGNHILVEGKTVHDTRISNAAHVRMSATAMIPQDTGSNFETSASKLSFNSISVDSGSNYSTFSSSYKVPFTNFYAVHARFMVALPDGTAVRMAVMEGALPLGEVRSYANGTNAQTYEISFVGQLSAGSDIWISATQSSSATATISPGDSNVLTTSLFTVHPLI